MHGDFDALTLAGAVPGHQGHGRGYRGHDGGEGAGRGQRQEQGLFAFIVGLVGPGGGGDDALPTALVAVPLLKISYFVLQPVH